MSIMTVDDRLAVLEAPAIPGLRFRRFAGESDYAGMAAVIAASSAIDGVERADTADDIARAYAHLVNSDPYQDMLMAEADGQLVGYSRGWWGREENGPWLYFHIGFLRPEWRGQGIGRAVLGHMEERLRQIAAGHASGAAERFYQTFAEGGEAARRALLESAGYKAVRYGFNMVRPLDEPIEALPLPAGLEVRPVGPEHYRAVWEADAEAFRDHWNYVPPTEADYQGWLDNANFNPALWQVAWDVETGQVAGMVQNFVAARENQVYQRQRGYTEGISTRRPWRRRGLARALLTRSLQMFKDMGMTEAALGVDGENPNGALQLYESVGFRVARWQYVYRKALG